MEKVCRDWAKQAFGEGLVDAKYWDEFATNAQTAAAEVYKVKDFAAGEAKLKELLAQYAPKEIIAVGGEENPALHEELPFWCGENLSFLLAFTL